MTTTWRATWRRSETVQPLAAGTRGEPLRQGTVGLADFPAGSYPACSLHGALNAVGAGKWRCLVEGCNTGATTAWPYRRPS